MKKRTKIFIVSILCLCLILILTKGISYAKYVSNSIWNYYLEAKRFYISSDYLDTTLIDNVNNNWDGDKVYFNIKNSENNKLVSEYDIDYTITCTTSNPDVTCKIENGTNTYSETLVNKKECVNEINDVDVSSYNEATCEEGGYTYKSVEVEKELYFTLESDSEIDEVTVTISVSSTSPYKKTVSGNFILKKDKSVNNSIQSKLTNYADYDRLIITNNYISNKCVKVLWDSSKLLIDTPILNYKSIEVDNNSVINQVIFELSSKNSVSFKYYKQDNLIHSINDFTILELDC